MLIPADSKPLGNAPAGPETRCRNVLQPPPPGKSPPGSSSLPLLPSIGLVLLVLLLFAADEVEQVLQRVGAGRGLVGAGALVLVGGHRGGLVAGGAAAQCGEQACLGRG